MNKLQKEFAENIKKHLETLNTFKRYTIAEEKYYDTEISHPAFLLCSLYGGFMVQAGFYGVYHGFDGTTPFITGAASVFLMLAGAALTTLGIKWSTFVKTRPKLVRNWLYD